MTTTANETRRLPEIIHLQEIKAEARQVNAGQAVQTLLLAPFFVIGWLLGKSSRAVVLMGTYMAVSARTGWRQARNEPLNQPKITDVLRENAMLRAEVQRLGGSG